MEHGAAEPSQLYLVDFASNSLPQEASHFATLSWLTP